MLDFVKQKEIFRDEFDECIVDSGTLNGSPSIMVDVRTLECPEHTMMLKLILRKYRGQSKFVVFVTQAATIVNDSNIKMFKSQLDLKCLDMKISNNDFESADEDNPIWVLYESTL